MPSQNWLAGVWENPHPTLLPDGRRNEFALQARASYAESARLLPLSPVGRDARGSGSEGTGEDRGEGAATPNLKSLVIIVDLV